MALKSKDAFDMNGLYRIDFYPRDWISGTRELSDRARGVYIDLLARIYDLGRPLDYDERDLCRYLGYRDRRQLIPVIKELADKGKIRIVDNLIVNDRAQREIAVAQERIAASKKGGSSPKPRKKGSRPGPERVLDAVLAPSQEGNIVEFQTHNGNPSPSPSPSKESNYAFEGKVVRLTQRDFDQWRESYPGVVDLRAWLQSRDDYLATRPEPERENWFHSTSKQLQKDNEMVARAAATAEANEQARRFAPL